MKSIAIIGGGPAALILAANLNKEKYKVTLFEKNKAVGRKFLVAGEGGLNLTYNSSVEEMIPHFFPSEFMAPLVEKFTNTDLIEWVNSLGITTFIGSSDRVFPDYKFKPIEVLNKMVESVTANEVEFKFDANWTGWTEDGKLTFDGYGDAEFDFTVFALGGSSWKVTGSDGEWSKIFEEKGLKTEPFKAVNCAFGVEWNKNFITTHRGRPLKNITLTFDKQVSKGELVITDYGLEGNAIYALSRKLQEKFLKKKSLIVHLDLKPTMTLDQIKAKYKASKLTKVTDILKEDLNLDRTSVGLLKQFTDKETFMNPDLLAEAINALPVTIGAADELDQAISTIGGIALNQVDKNFKLKKLTNAYAIGEMLDWYAPTGGYLLQGCFSMGHVLAKHLNAKRGTAVKAKPAAVKKEK